MRNDYWGAILEAPDAVTLGRFYAELLGWEVLTEEPSIATEVEDLEAAVTHAIELGAGSQRINRRRTCA